MANYTKNKKFPQFHTLFFALLTISASLWIALTSYVSAKVENDVRWAINEQKIASSSVYLELLEYKSSLFDGYFLSRLRAENKKLDQTLNGLVFKTSVKHGPIIIDQNSLHLAFAQLETYFDQSSSSESSNEFVTRLFGDANPLDLKTVVDYDLDRHYEMTTASFKYEVSDLVLDVAEGKMAGSYAKSATSLPIDFSLGRVILTQGGVEIESKASTIQLNASDQERAKISIPAIKINSDELNTPALVGASVKLTQYLSDQVVAGIRTHKTVTDEADETQHSSVSLDLAKVDIGSAIELFERYEEQHNIAQQIVWTLENSADNQEGQDRLIELFHKHEDMHLPRAGIIVAQLLDDKGTLVSFSQDNKKSPQGSNIEAEIAYNDVQLDSSVDK